MGDSSDGTGAHYQNTVWSMSGCLESLSPQPNVRSNHWLPKMFDIHCMMINMFTLYGFLLQWKVLMGKKSNGDVCVEE